MPTKKEITELLEEQSSAEVAGFFVQGYVMLKNLVEVLNLIGVSDNTQVYILDDGYSKDYKFKIEAEGQPFLLKCYREKTPKKVEREIDFLSFLHSNQYPVPKIIFGQSTPYLAKTDLGVWVLSDFVEGEVAEWPHLLTNQQLELVGTNLAEQHLISSRYPGFESSSGFPIITRHLDTGFYIDLYSRVISFLEEQSSLNSEDSALKEVLLRKRKELMDFPDEVNQAIAALPKLMIHGDFHGSNISFGKEGQIKAVFDWEYLEYWMRVAEVHAAVCMMCKQNSHNHFNSPVDFDRARILYSAYQRVFPLSKEEISFLPDIARLDSYRIDFELGLKFDDRDPDYKLFLPQRYSDWFWWQENADIYLESVFA